METKQGEGDTPPKLESSSTGDESEQQKKKTPPVSTETETDRSTLQLRGGKGPDRKHRTRRSGD